MRVTHTHTKKRARLGVDALVSCPHVHATVHCHAHAVFNALPRVSDPIVTEAAWLLFAFNNQDFNFIEIDVKLLIFSFLNNTFSPGVSLYYGRRDQRF